MQMPEQDKAARRLRELEEAIRVLQRRIVVPGGQAGDVLVRRFGRPYGAAWEHRHLTGTLAARPTPGEAGRLYTASDLGVRLEDDGTEWHVIGHLPKLCAYWGDDFIATRALNWGLKYGGGSVEIGMDKVGGWWSLSLTAAGQIIIYPQDRATYSGGYKSLTTMRLKINVEDASGNMRSGWLSTLALDDNNPTDGIFIRKLGTGNFFGVCRASSAETTQDLGVDGTAETLYIVERDAGGVSFYVNTYNAAGKQGGTITTNLPTAGLRFGHKLSGGGTPDFFIDDSRLWVARSA